MATTAISPQCIDWGVTYEQFWSKILGYIYHHTRDERLSEDLTADVFIRAMKSTGEGDDLINHLSGWLYRIAHNRLVDYYRWKGAHPEPDSIEEFSWLFETGMPDPSQNPEEEYEREVEAEAVRDVVSRYLNGPQKEVILLTFWEDMGPQEIGKRVGKSEGAVVSLRHRALAKLRSMPGRYDRPSEASSSCLAQVQEALRTYGPMTSAQIARTTGESPYAVRGALAVGRSSQDLCVVGKVKDPMSGVMLYVYGVEGVHSQEAA